MGLCIYADDGICDEPSGTGLCPDGTDGADCAGSTSGWTSDPSWTSDATYTSDPSWGYTSSTSSGGWWDESTSSTGEYTTTGWTSSGY